MTRKLISPLLGGILLALISISGYLLVGQVYSASATRQLIEAMIPSVRTLCFALITACSTIVPLMLTILSMVNRADAEFDSNFFRQIKQITLFSAITIMISTVLLVIVSIPITETNEMRRWFNIFYYIIIVSSSTIAGIFTAVVIMLYDMITDIIAILSPVDL